MPRHSRQVCVYCGKQTLKKDSTRDHIPPKCLFDPLPQNAITVPSCRKCNGSASNDDEYFRFVCVSNYNGYTHPGQEKLFSKITGSLAHKSNRLSDRKVKSEFELPAPYRAMNSMFKGARRVYIDDTYGIIQPTLAMPVNVDKIKRVVDRIVKGLTWKENNKRLPKNYEVNIHFDGFHYLDGNQPNLGYNQLEALTATLKKQPTIIGNDVFAYWNLPSTEDKLAGTWILEFYKQTYFCCFVNKATSPM